MMNSLGPLLNRRLPEPPKGCYFEEISPSQLHRYFQEQGRQNSCQVNISRILVKIILDEDGT